MSTDFESYTPDEQFQLLQTSVYIGSSRVEGVPTSLFLAKGNHWVEVFYEESGEEINFMSVCPESRLHLYVEGYDLADLL